MSGIKNHSILELIYEKFLESVYISISLILVILVISYTGETTINTSLIDSVRLIFAQMKLLQSR